MIRPALVFRKILCVRKKSALCQEVQGIMSELLDSRRHFLI